ncbi:hypothetical protein EDF81_2302 [Enterobacter sp. BIGb0383]|uniref:hypothetical protein n=1 Tax=unclassified Enterobacter TaxID=2608935 RepID=UPI000F475092|nr:MULTISPECIES: hypothetical protein [unclassified Enterobacter]ROP59494.1 hypothetical protein EDF81_2302 [Enterobacter sp. BIGb0383]ROS09039.1 hypothetical protein EC848_2539 [Enterobacter sp. BIGb0359]
MTKKGRLFILLMLITGVRAEANLNVNWTWQNSLESEQSRHTKLNNDSGGSTQSLDSLITSTVEWNNITGTFVMTGNNLLATDSQNSTDKKFIVQELFWQPEMKIAGLPLDISVGKERLDWGVGYGFRPLDIFKSYERNPPGIQVDEGVGAATASWFDGTGQWELVATDESWTSSNTDQARRAKKQHGIGFRRYALLRNTELQGIMYFDQVHYGTVGGSVVAVLSPALEVHSSFAYAQRYQAYKQGDINEPVKWAMGHDSYQFLLGLNWANTAGLNIIGEYWYDGRSWDKKMWKQAIQRSGELSHHSDTRELASSYSYGLYNRSLVAQNLMLHFKMDMSALHSRRLWLEKFEPSVDLLISPTDGGLVATPRLSYQVYESGQSDMTLELVSRFYTGFADSVYANVPDRNLTFINLKVNF